VEGRGGVALEMYGVYPGRGVGVTRTRTRMRTTPMPRCTGR